jgi:D-alanyl-D-alanine carboxypeptidase
MRNESLERRNLLKLVLSGVSALLAGCSILNLGGEKQKIASNKKRVKKRSKKKKKKKVASQVSFPSREITVNNHHDADIKDNIDKVKNFDKTFQNDLFLPTNERVLIRSTWGRIAKVRRYIGYGNFNLIGFDDLLKTATNSPIGSFSREEIEFMEKIFYRDASQYGFYGKKVLTHITTNISNRHVLKIPYTGHYLYRGDALNVFKKVKKDVGKTILLTSGIRSIVKQMDLFLAKTISSDYNLSKASRSLAPPGYSYHGIGDFDVGKVGFGENNFTAKFATTSEFQKLNDLGYLSIRYTTDNKLGVRYEPWHIKVVSSS